MVDLTNYLVNKEKRAAAAARRSTEVVHKDSGHEVITPATTATGGGGTGARLLAGTPIDAPSGGVGGDGESAITATMPAPAGKAGLLYRPEMGAVTGGPVVTMRKAIGVGALTHPLGEGARASPGQGKTADEEQGLAVRMLFAGGGARPQKKLALTGDRSGATLRHALLWGTVEDLGATGGTSIHSVCSPAENPAGALGGGGLATETLVGAQTARAAAGGRPLGIVDVTIPWQAEPARGGSSAGEKAGFPSVQVQPHPHAPCVGPVRAWPGFTLSGLWGRPPAQPKTALDGDWVTGAHPIIRDCATPPSRDVGVHECGAYFGSRGRTSVPTTRLQPPQFFGGVGQAEAGVHCSPPLGSDPRYDGGQRVVSVTPQGKFTSKPFASGATSLRLPGQGKVWA